MREKRRLLRNRIIITYLSIGAVMLIAVGMHVITNTAIRNNYNVNMQRNSLLVRLPFAITKTKQFFEQYLRDHKRNTMKSYQRYNRQVEAILAQLEEQFESDQHSLTYIRIVSTMHAYQEKSIKNFLTRSALTPQGYQEISFLKRVFDSMNTQSQQFIMAGLKTNANEYRSFLEKLKRREQTVNLIMVITMAAGIALVFWMTNDSFHTLNEIHRAARLLSEGHWEIADLAAGRYQELNAVALAFNNMKHDIRRYLKQSAEKARLEIRLQKEKLANLKKGQLLKEMQLNLLQRQINPHFLFNTLNMIGKAALLQSPEVTLELIEAISKILRYNLEHEGTVIDLQSELEVVKAYLFIQQNRFQEQMHFLIEEDAGLSRIKVLPMIIQPLVENAIIHGMADKKENGLITLSFHKAGGFLLIIIADNGCGFNPDHFSGRDGTKTSIGLTNIRQRLQLHYQRNDLFMIESHVNQGTKVTIKIPLGVG
jgi:two-component system sensor histidine kinase YesM